MIAYLIGAIVGVGTMVCSVISDNVPLAIMGAAFVVSAAMLVDGSKER